MVLARQVFVTEFTCLGAQNQPGREDTARSNSTNSLLCTRSLWLWSAAFLVGLVVFGNIAYFGLLEPETFSHTNSWANVLPAVQLGAISSNMHQHNVLSAGLAERKLMAADDRKKPRHLNISNIWHKHIMHSVSKAEQKLTAAGVHRKARPARIFIPMLSQRPDCLCDMLSTYSWTVAPFNNTSDIFVFSQDKSAEAAFTERRDQPGSSCSNISGVSITLHFMPVKEYWEVPQGTAADERLWSMSHRFKKDYRLMTCFLLQYAVTSCTAKAETC